MIGRQFAGRVGLFLRVDDFDEAYERMSRYGVEFHTAPRTEPYVGGSVQRPLRQQVGPLDLRRFEFVAARAPRTEALD